MHLVIFEDAGWATFAPLAFNRPVFSLFSGMSTLLEKQIRHIAPSRLTLWVRQGLAEFCKKNVLPNLPVPTAVNTPLDHEPALLINGRSLHLGRYLPPAETSVVVDDGDVIHSAFVHSPGLSPQDCMSCSAAWMKLLNLPRAAPQARLPAYVWDLTHWNEEAIASDTIQLRDQPNPLPSGPYHAVGDGDIFISPDVKIAPGVVLDASRGPVVLDVGANIGANSVVQGPCYIGRHSSVAPVSFIHGGTSVGPVCKVGGEVANTIILGYSNKGHEGFLGHSYLGEWVNLGAGTNTSNLKNTYGAIKMRIGSREIATGHTFLGSMIGDHSKTAIATRLMSGTYIGYGSMLASSAISPTFVPSFQYITDRGSEPYQLDKARHVMSQVYLRRGRHWASDDDAMLGYVKQTVGQVES